MDKKWFPLARKSLVHLHEKLPLAGIFLKNWIPPNFNDGFDKQKESSGIRAHPE